MERNAALKREKHKTVPQHHHTITFYTDLIDCHTHVCSLQTSTQKSAVVKVTNELKREKKKRHHGCEGGFPTTWQPKIC